jgi:hypothetical protein
MKRVIVQYKVKADRAAENEAYVRKVFEELKQTTPDGIRYATFKQADGVSFVHIASIETEDGNSPLNESPAFKAFQAEINGRSRSARDRVLPVYGGLDKLSCCLAN